ncbi:MAG: hypothetical protein JNL59_16255 [Chitinophagaceae bacterium]|jgi:hypothetical protein|nr:hypothetical protein [Chitinophagaceae bacterium]
MAGYSGTPLARKLGLTKETQLLLFHAPDGYMSWLQPDGPSTACSTHTLPDVVHVFVEKKAELKKYLFHLEPVFARNPKLVLWISWYKKAARMPTDITEDIIRELALPMGLVDIKVCAVNELWSGLKLVRRLANR